MALIKCPECGKEFSDKAIACPNCACPIDEVVAILVEQEQNEKTVLCPYCAERVSAEDGYCDSCGMKILLKVEKKIFCSFCGAVNLSTDETCARCGMTLFFRDEEDCETNSMCEPSESKKESINQQDMQVTKELQSVPTYSDPKGNIFTKAKCPRCYSLNFSPIDTKKKFSLGKALVGNTVGFLAFGAVGGVIGAATGLKGKTGKTKFVCHNCGKVWEQKV